jgi:hypothetical protein
MKFDRRPKAGSRPRTGVRDADPIAARAVSNLELKREGFYRSCSSEEIAHAEKVARTIRHESLRDYATSERKYRETP